MSLADEIEVSFIPSARTAKITVALAGIPNAGKTSLFNALTGMRYKVANYPGVTVEKKKGPASIASLPNTTIVDLPGTYSLFGGSPDENIAVDFLLGLINNEALPDAIVCVVDACNLERNLYLCSQLIDSGLPVIIGLSMNDIASNSGIRINKESLARLMQVPVVDISGRVKSNLEQLATEILKSQSHPITNSVRYKWCDSPRYLEIANSLATQYTEATAAGTNSPSLQKTAIGIGLLSGTRSTQDTALKSSIEAARSELTAAEISPGTFETQQRYCWVANVAANSCSLTDDKLQERTAKIDRVVTHPLWGSLIFLVIMGTMFQSIFTWASVPMDFIDGLVSQLQTVLREQMSPGDLRDLLVDGIVTGVGAVIIFVPQIAILYIFISLLEESGYLTRAAFLLDRGMRKCGLQGRSFVPLLSSFACAVPGIMSARSIPSFSDRMTTILIAPLMSCSARIPVYTLLIAAFVPAVAVLKVFSLQGLVFLGLYLLGIIGAMCAAWCFKKSVFREAPTHFIMEMPPYRIPSLKNVVFTAVEKSGVFIKQAGTVILACSIILWFLASYPKHDHLPPEQAVAQSYAGKLGHLIEPTIRPLGFDWQIGVGLIASFAAREVFVSSMALVHNLEDADETSSSLIDSIRNAKDPETGLPRYSIATALSLLVFFVFACQCMSTVAICKRETGSWKWAAVMFCYMTAMAYVLSLVTYQVATLFL